MAQSTSTQKPGAPERAVTPVGVNHLVLNVRDIEESHQFWTEIVGMQEVGRLKPGTPERPRPTMRFYSADHDGKMNHHFMPRKSRRVSLNSSI